VLVSRYLIYNKKRTFITILSVALAVTLLIGIGLLFSSIHSYLVNLSLKENPYHVTFSSDNFEKTSYIKKKAYIEAKVYIKYKNVLDTYKNTKKICSKIKCQNISYNDRVLSLYGISKNKNTMKTFKILFLSVLFILGIAILILITNSFRINLIERKKQIGILKSIGMTKLQIMKMLFLEGTVILLIGLIIGIIISLWLLEVLFFIVNYLLIEVLKTKIILTFYPLFIEISLGFIIIIFYVGCIIPIFKVNRLSSIELLRESSIFKTKKIPWHFKILKGSNKLVLSNYYRNKKKYRAIKLCIFISSILYISFSLYLNYGLSSIDKYVNIPSYNFYIGALGNDNNYNILDEFGQKYKKYSLYKTCMIEGSISKNSYLNKNYNNKIMVISSDKERIINTYTKDNIKKRYFKNEVNLNKNIIKTTNNIPFGFENSDFNNVLFLTDNFDNYCTEYNLNLYIKDNSKKIKKSLNKIKTDINYIDVSKITQITNNFVLTIKISLYSVLILVIAIGILLTSSTYSVNLNLRVKEFGVLKSVGITNRHLKCLLFLESFIIIIKTFIFIILFSFLISYSLYSSVNKILDINMIKPYKEIVISFFVSIFIIYFTLNSNYKKIMKKEVIKMITNDNV